MGAGIVCVAGAGVGEGGGTEDERDGNCMVKKFM